MLTAGRAKSQGGVDGIEDVITSLFLKPTACLDYCNSVLYGVTDNLLLRLQSVQNAAARLITRTDRREHISPVLQKLHWLPVRQRVDFKLATLMFKLLHGAIK